MSRTEIVSGEELIAGDVDEVLGGYDIIGRRAAPRPRYNAALQQAAAFKQAGAGVVLRDQAPTKARRLVLPMASSGTVAAAASSTITARPQTIAFKPQRIVVPATIAPDFTIDDIKVGNKSQLAQSGSLPAEAFVQSLFDGMMDMDTVQTSQDFVLAVTNLSGAARTFRAAVYGRSAD